MMAQGQYGSLVRVGDRVGLVTGEWAQGKPIVSGSGRSSRSSLR